MTADPQTTAPADKPAAQPRNGINTPALFATLDAEQSRARSAVFDIRS
jgi:hypothetical protein